MKGREDSKVSTWVLSDWTMQRNLSSATHTMVSEDMKAATQGKVLIRLPAGGSAMLVFILPTNNQPAADPGVGQGPGPGQGVEQGEGDGGGLAIFIKINLKICIYVLG